MNLSVELESWRADRPDEWKMDEFIRKASKLEKENAELREIARQHTELASKGIYYSLDDLKAHDRITKAEAGKLGYIQAICDLGYKDCYLIHRANEYAESIVKGE